MKVPSPSSPQPSSLPRRGSPPRRASISALSPVCVWSCWHDCCWVPVHQRQRRARFKGRLCCRQCTAAASGAALGTGAPVLTLLHTQHQPQWQQLPGVAAGSRQEHEVEITAVLKMNSSLVGNQSGRPFCLLAISYLETINFCLLEVVIIVFLMVLIISGNIIVIFVFHCAPLLNHHTTSYFIQTMAYADLLVGVSCLVPSLSLLHYPIVLSESLVCQIFGYVVSVLKSVSMASLACISIDRYIAITKPLTYNTLVTPWRLRICILIIWLYSCLVFLPSFRWGKPGYHGDVFQWCANSWNTDPYFTLFIVVMLYAPAAFIVCFTYFNIFRICQQHTKEINERRVRFSSQDGEAGEAQPCPDKRYAMVLFRITSVFYILWLPYIIYFLLESSNVYSNRVASFLTTWLAISNSFCNCVIYSLSNSVFQKGLKRLSGAICASCARQRVAKDSSTSRSKRSSNGCHV